MSVIFCTFSSARSTDSTTSAGNSNIAQPVGKESSIVKKIVAFLTSVRNVSRFRIQKPNHQAAAPRVSFVLTHDQSCTSKAAVA